MESGLPKLNVMFTDTIPSNRLRLNELVLNAGKTDPDVEVIEVQFQKEASEAFWKEAVHPMITFYTFRSLGM